MRGNTLHLEKRWLHSLCPTIKKTAWTREEDELLLSLYAIHSTKWSVIARQIPGRTDDACSKRYREALDPSLKKGDWTPEEDLLLLQAYQRLGGKWGQIGAELQRSGLGCRNRCARNTAMYGFRRHDIYVCRWRLLDRKNMTLDRAHEQSSSSPQCTSTGWAGIPLLSQNLWHDSQIARFSGHMPTTMGRSDPCINVPSASAPMFQFASSSLSSALSPSVLSSNRSPIHLQKDGAPSYMTGNCGSPRLDLGNPQVDVDYDDVNQDHHPTDPDRGSTSGVIDIPLNSAGAHRPVCFPVPPKPTNELPSANGSIPNNARPHANLPNVDVEMSCVTSAPVFPAAVDMLPVSVPPMSPAHDVDMAHCGPVPSIPETLTLEESSTPGPSSRSESGAFVKPKRGKNGANYKLSSSLPVNIE